MPEEIRLSVRNIELAALRWRANSKVRILALHGWLDNAQSFAPLAEKLPDYDIVAVDFPGHGHSEHRPVGEILHFVDYIADVYAVLKALDWDSCVLIGHSMGGGVASLFASAFPEKLSGLVCLDGLGPITGESQDLVARLKKSVQLNTKSVAQSKTVYKSVEQAVEARFKAGDLSKSSVQRLVERSLLEVSNGYCWRSDSRLRLPSAYYFTEQQVQACLSGIQVPTLMFRPVNSAYRVEKTLKSRAALIKNLNWVEMSGGHHAHMDQADELLKPLKNFVDKVVPGISTA